MGPERLKIMERWNLAFAALATLLAALFAPAYFMWGVAVGGALCCVNFYVIRRIWQALLHGAIERRQAMQFLFVVKTMLLFGLVFVIITFVPVSPVGFAVGISVFLPSILIETARFALFGAASGGSAIKS